MDYAKLIRASLDIERELATRDYARQELRANAAACAGAGRVIEAVEAYRKLLTQDEHDAAAWSELARLYLAQGQFASACESLLHALTQNPDGAQAHFDFGAAARQIEPASSHLREYLKRLGLTVTAQTAADDLLAHAEAQCQLTCAQSSAQAESFARLGHILLARGLVTQAARAYNTAHQLQSGDVTTAENLAVALRLQGESSRAALLLGQAYYRARRYGEAIPHYQLSLKQQTGSDDTYAELAHALNHEKQFNEAIAICLAAIQQHPAAPDLYYEWAYALLEINHTEEAVAVAASAAERFPNHVKLAHQRDLALPIVYENSEDIARWRARFTAGLQRVCHATRLHDAEAARAALQAIDNPYYLAYQGLDDASLKRQFGELVQHIMHANFPQYAEPRAMPALAAGERIKVGYISASMRWSGVAEIFLGWLGQHDSDGFELYVYNVGKSADLVARQFELLADHYQQLPREAPRICEQVIADDCHILVYLDIGMDPLMTQLAALRLAPVQCAASGHPVTTGLPTVDYFISAQFAEPEDAQKHYTEQLVMLPNIGICPRKPFPPAQGQMRAQWGFNEDAVVYFSPQSVVKYLPQHDELFAAIAQRMPAARFLFMPRGVKECVDIFRARLLREFARCGLDGDRFIRFIPGVEYQDYLRINRSVDIFLDTLGWSGGLSTLDALGCGLPVVTCPGAYMRGRQSSAYLRQLGITDTIASDTGQYVEIAVRLGLDAAWRAQVSQRISQQVGRLYDSEERVRGLECFYRSAAQNRLENVTHA